MPPEILSRLTDDPTQTRRPIGKSAGPDHQGREGEVCILLERRSERERRIVSNAAREKLAAEFSGKFHNIGLSQFDKSRNIILIKKDVRMQAELIQVL